MSTGRAACRTHRRGPACAVALAVLAGVACATGRRQPTATDASLRRVAAAVRHDIYGRPLELSPLLAGRAVLYFFRTDCPHCAAGTAAAAALAARPGMVALVLISREAAAPLRAALGPTPRPGLAVVSDSDGAIMGSALPTLFVPRVVAVQGFAVRLDVTGDGAGIADAVAALSGSPR